MQPCTDRHAIAVHDLGDVVGMRALDGEGEDRPLPFRRADLRQPVAALLADADMRQQGLFVRRDRRRIERQRRAPHPFPRKLPARRDPLTAGNNETHPLPLPPSPSPVLR